MTNKPNQTFSATIPQGANNIRLAFFVNWNEISGFWQMTIGNIETQEQLINLMPLVNEFPLHQYQYFNISEIFMIKIGNTSHDYPDIADWGENFNLFWS